MRRYIKGLHAEKTMKSPKIREQKNRRCYGNLFDFFVCIMS